MKVNNIWINDEKLIEQKLINICANLNIKKYRYCSSEIPTDPIIIIGYFSHCLQHIQQHRTGRQPEKYQHHVAVHWPTSSIEETHDSLVQAVTHHFPVSSVLLSSPSQMMKSLVQGYYQPTGTRMIQHPCPHQVRGGCQSVLCAACSLALLNIIQ